MPSSGGLPKIRSSTPEPDRRWPIQRRPSTSAPRSRSSRSRLSREAGLDGADLVEEIKENDFIELPMTARHSLASAVFQAITPRYLSGPVGSRGGNATSGKSEGLIRHGGYHVLHFAGHGWPSGAEPALAVPDSVAKDWYVAIGLGTPPSGLRDRTRALSPE